MGRRFVKCEKNIKLIITLLENLGFVVPQDKSMFVPARSVEYLGFENDSQSVTIFWTQKKKAFKTVMSGDSPGKISEH